MPITKTYIGKLLEKCEHDLALIKLSSLCNYISHMTNRIVR